MWLEKKKIKVFEDDLKSIPDESFRKIRGGKKPKKVKEEKIKKK